MIYFDNAATTPPLSFTQDTASISFGNPSAPHALGIATEHRIRDASRILAGLLGCDNDEIVYTSGGTESNNLALLGAAARYMRRGGHILTTPAEHPSVAEPLHYLAEAGFHVQYAPPSEWPALVREDTVLASLVHVHNETGAIHDVSVAAENVKAINPRVIVHADGAQSFGKIPMDLHGVDLYSFCAHKMHGPVGVGGLMVRRGVRLAPLMFGGGQQNNLRPGTENTVGIVSMAETAAALTAHQACYTEQVSAVGAVVAGLAHTMPDVYVNRGDGKYSPYILSMSFVGVKSETLVNALSELGIYVAYGAACRSRKRGRLPLSALGYDQARAESAVRFSFSHLNTVDEAEQVKAAVMQIVTRLRQMGSRQFANNGKAAHAWT